MNYHDDISIFHPLHNYGPTDRPPLPFELSPPLFIDVGMLDAVMDWFVEAATIIKSGLDFFFNERQCIGHKLNLYQYVPYSRRM